MIVRLAPVLVALAVAGGLFANGTAVARQGASPTAEPASLLGRLPALAHLSPGFVLADESIEFYDSAGSPIASPAAL